MLKYTLQEAQEERGQRRSYLYNAVDNIAQRQIMDILTPRADPSALRTYGMERSVQNAAFAMSCRGVLIDETLRAARVHELTVEAGKIERKLGKDPQITAIWDKLAIASDPKLFGKKAGICPKSTRKDRRHTWPRGVEDSVEKHCECCGMPRLRILPFSATSPDQVQHLLYDLLGCKKQYNAMHKVSVDEECLNRIGKSRKSVAALCQRIADIRDLKKQISLLNARLRDGRFTTAFNVGTTSTDRWSSNADAFHCGGNIQNIPERHRDIFIADPGKKLFYADLKQAESKTIAYVSGDDLYIKAHDDDTHTFVCRLVWPELPWTGDIKSDKKIAQSTYPEWDNVAGHDYRFQSKKNQHGSNLGLTPFGMAMKNHTPVAAAVEGQRRYFRAFPGIRPWQRWVRFKVEHQEPLVNPLGVRFLMYGRPWDEHTYKQGLACVPQSTVANIINLAAERVWDELDPWKLWLLGQVHDALLGEVDDGDIATIRKVLKLMTIPIPVEDIKGEVRTMIIEPEIAWGYNWGHGSKTNPDGLQNVNF